MYFKNKDDHLAYMRQQWIKLLLINCTLIRKTKDALLVLCLLESNNWNCLEKFLLSKMNLLQKLFKASIQIIS